MDNQTTSRSFKYASKYSAAVVVLSFTTVTCALAAAFLFTITIWSFLRKMFVYTYFMEVKMDTTFFTIPAGTLCLPMVVLTILLKSHKLKYMLTFLVLQTISISLLFAGNFVGMIYQLDYSNETVRLSSTLPREALNNTLYHLISAYEKSDGNNHSAVDKIQIKFRCCGIDGKNDFSDVPESCCPEFNCEEHNAWPKGCLMSIQEDVAWHKQITASLTQLFLLMCVHFAPEMWEKTREDGTRRLRWNAVPTIFPCPSSFTRRGRPPAKRHDQTIETVEMAPPTNDLVWVSPLNKEFVKPGVEKKCPWREWLGKNVPSPHTKQDWEQKYSNGVFPDVLSMIGNTPLVKLNSIPKKEGLKCNIYAKCEFLNPGGSIKDRMVKRMFEDAEKQGLIKPGMTIIEPSSGNTGIAVALISSLRGYKCIIVMSEKISEEKEAVITSLGARVVRVPVTAGSFDKNGLFGTVNRLHKEIPNSFILDQFNHPGNPLTHYDTTANEILHQLDNKVDMIVFGGGTGGTVTGIGRKFREVSPQTKIVGFDPEGSHFAYPESLNKSDVTFWEVEGIGYEFVPGALDQHVCDYWVKTNDAMSLPMAKRLMKEEGLLVGMSAGAAVAAAVTAAKDLTEGQNVVVFLPDSIRNYMTKFVSDRWMEAKGYQPCENINNLWWWNKPVSSLKYRNPELVNSKDTLESVLTRLQTQNKEEAIVTLSNGNMLGTITTHILRNKLVSGLLQPTDLVERCTTRILPKLDNNSILGRAFRIIEGDKFAVIVETTGAGATKIESPLGVIYGEDLYAYISKGQ